MAKEAVKIADLAQLREKLADILVDGPLYTAFRYQGDGLHFDHSGHMGQVTRFGLLPETIFMECPVCKGKQNWQVNRPDFYFGAHPEPTEVNYYCKNCPHRAQTQYFWLEWTEGSFIKIGQWPPPAIDIGKELAKALGPEDAQLYKKALINANFGHGIAAVAYFRRVIENKVNDLIDLVADAAKTNNPSDRKLKQIHAIKLGKRIDKKIEFAKGLLPKHLQPGGQNPIEKLYGVASVGLHGESDEVCLALFAQYKTSFEYLFRNLTVADAEAKAFIQQMNLPAPKGTK
jgi:hypothetical protein